MQGVSGSASHNMAAGVGPTGTPSGVAGVGPPVNVKYETKAESARASAGPDQRQYLMVTQQPAVWTLEQLVTEQQMMIALQRASGRARYTVTGIGAIHIGCTSPFNKEQARLLAFAVST